MSNKKQISLDEEMLMWCAYRYCIGRQTYVTSLAPYIGKKYYPLLSDEKAEHTAKDIRNCIADVQNLLNIYSDYDLVGYSINKDGLHCLIFKR